MDAAERFFSWWGKELRELVPDGLVAKTTAIEAQLVIQWEGDDLICYDVRGVDWRHLGQFPVPGTESAERHSILADLRECLAHTTTVRLMLPQSHVLRRRVPLPVAARENLREVLSFEMDRQTPFLADQVYYDYRVSEVPPGAEELSVELVVVPRSAVDVLLDRVESLGIPLDSVEVAPRDGNALDGRNSRINLLPMERRTRFSPRLSLMNVTLAGLTATLLLVALSLPIVTIKSTEARLEAEVSAMQEHAEQVLELRERLQSRVEETVTLMRLKQSAPAVIGVLAEVARILPDSTWLSVLDLRQNVLQIRGQSAASSDLISVIEDSPTFHGVSFASPVTQDPNTGNERFEIRANIAARG